MQKTIWLWIYGSQTPTVWGAGMTAEEAQDEALKEAQKVADEPEPFDTEPVIQEGFSVKLTIEADTLDQVSTAALLVKGI